jgi:type I restriction enzyme, R subunit
VPKTLIFCKDDAHAEEVVTTVQEVFGKGNDFAAKITYNAKDPKGHLQRFRTSASLRVAVTVDMIATGTDVKPLECVFFMRDVRSAQDSHLGFRLLAGVLDGCPCSQPM